MEPECNDFGGSVSMVVRIQERDQTKHNLMPGGWGVNVMFYIREQVSSLMLANIMNLSVKPWFATADGVS